MFRPNKLKLLSAFFLMLGVGALAFLQIPNEELVVSPETTFVTEPVLPDGRVDYQHAVNALLSDGVTPENNAVVVLGRAMQLIDSGNPAIDEEFWNSLGVEPIHVEHRLVELSELRTNTDPLPDGSPVLERRWEEFDRIVSEPWKRRERPEWAEMIDLQQDAFDIVVEASRRPRFYFPLIGDGGLLYATLDVAQQFRPAVRNLAARAMLRLGENDVEGAIEDLRAARRLASLLRQSGTLIEMLIAIAAEGIVSRAEAALIESDQLSDEQLRDWREFLLMESPWERDFVDRLLVYERITGLDTVQGIFWNRISSELTEPVFPAGRFPGLYGDRTSTFREVNSWYDRLKPLQTAADYPARLKILDDWENDLEKLVAGIQPGPGMFKKILSPRSRGEVMGQIMISLLGPAARSVATAETRALINDQLLIAAIDLQLYRRQQGEYPQRLEQLVPDFRESLPEDWFGSGSVQFRREGAGYVLYSVGTDGVDNGGNPDDLADWPLLRIGNGVR